MRIVIIGNSATAVGAVETIRHYDQSVDILMVSEEPHLIYSRPLLSHYLAGEIDTSRLCYRQADFYTKHEVQPILDTRVVAIDPAERTVRTATGHTYAYDKLLISTGGTPVVPPLKGTDMGGVYTFTRYADVARMEAQIAGHDVHHVIVVGGGMIGIKATDALMKRGFRVVMAELAPRILSMSLDDTGSRLLSELLEREGVRVLTENTVDEIRGEPCSDSDDLCVSSVQLRDGRGVACELLVFGIGVRPNADLARQAGIQVNRGVVVDAFMRTSAPDVYAAGDVAEAYDLVVDMNRAVAIWPNAYRQGAIAGAHIVGVERPDRGGVAMNTVEVCGVAAMGIGDSAATGDEYEELVELDERNTRYKRLVLKEGRLVGAILIGDVNRAGIYTGLIRAKLDVEPYRKSLLSEHFGLLSLPDAYRKHVVTGHGIEV